MIDGEEEAIAEDAVLVKVVKEIAVETKERKIVRKEIETVDRKRKRNIKSIGNHHQAPDHDSLLLCLIFNISMKYI